MSIYGDMNYYGNLLKIEDSRIYYEYGCGLDNTTGILVIDKEEETWNNEKFPDGIEVETAMFRMFANKVLGECIKGEIREKVSREIG